MMTDFLDRWAESNEANAKLVAQETLIAEITESLWGVLEHTSVSKSELAARLGTSKGHVSQVLSGSRNMTLRTLSDLCFALKAKPRVSIDFDTEDAGGWSSAEERVALVAPRQHLRLVAENGVPVAGPDWPMAA